MDCDGRDEIIAGGTCLDDDGSILWGTTDWRGAAPMPRRAPTGGLPSEEL